MYIHIISNWDNKDKIIEVYQNYCENTPVIIPPNADTKYVEVTLHSVSEETLLKLLIFGHENNEVIIIKVDSVHELKEIQNKELLQELKYFGLILDENYEKRYGFGPHAAFLNKTSILADPLKSKITTALVGEGADPFIIMECDDSIDTAIQNAYEQGKKDANQFSFEKLDRVLDWYEYYKEFGDRQGTKLSGQALMERLLAQLNHGKIVSIDLLDGEV